MKEIKVALINSGTNSDLAIHEPSNLGLLASFLRARNINVRIIDQLAGENPFQVLKKEHFDLVGVTGVTTVIKDAYKIADYARKNNLLTVLGGVHSSFLPQEALAHADFIIKGEGENALLQLCNEVINNNCNFRNRIRTGQLIANIDDIPHSARDLINMPFYLKTKKRNPHTHLFFAEPSDNVSGVVFMRGCPYRCTFCYNSWRDYPVRFNSADYMITEIKQIVNDYGANAFFFMDDNLFAHKLRLETFCKKLIEAKLNIKFGCQARVDTINKDSIAIAKKAGCKQISFGMESGSQHTLDAIKKNTTIEQNRNAIKMCREIGVTPVGSFIIGTPNETKVDIQKTYDFIKETQIYSAVAIAIAYPGSELWLNGKKEGLIPDKLEYLDLANGKYPINTKIPYPELEKAYYSIMNLCNDINPKLGKYGFNALFNYFCRHPYHSSKYLVTHPNRLMNIIKNSILH